MRIVLECCWSSVVYLLHIRAQGMHRCRRRHKSAPRRLMYWNGVNRIVIQRPPEESRNSWAMSPRRPAIFCSRRSHPRRSRLWQRNSSCLKAAGQLPATRPVKPPPANRIAAGRVQNCALPDASHVSRAVIFCGRAVRAAPASLHLCRALFLICQPATHLRPQTFPTCIGVAPGVNWDSDHCRLTMYFVSKPAESNPPAETQPRGSMSPTTNQPQAMR